MTPEHPRAINPTVPDPAAYNPLAHLVELADGDYPTGRHVEGFTLKGGIIGSPHDEVVIIKRHRCIGFRLPGGNALMFP